VQHRFTRMIPGFSKLPYCERLKRLGLYAAEPTSLKYLRWLKDSLEYQWNLFEVSTTKHLRGHELKSTDGTVWIITQ